LDQSIPLDDEAKASMIKNLDSNSREFFLPLIRPFTWLALIVFQLLKIILPNSRAPKLMHWLIYIGLKYFVKPEASFIILRHFHIGSEVLAFLAGNVDHVSMQLNPLRPQNLEAVKHNLFVQHDLNLYNFIISLNSQLRHQHKTVVEPKPHLDFSMITDGPFPIDPLPRHWTNVIDVQTAIELYTPLYQLLLSDSDFWRATNSLQLDETIGIYVSRVLQTPHNLTLVNNKHPLVPKSILQAGYRLMLHGLASETLHAILREKKRAAIK
jgi:hypothetical protein